MSLDHCRILDMPTLRDARGRLTFIEGGEHIPFEIARVFYLHDIPTGAERGKHAHRELHQFIIAIAGSFTVVLDDGNSRRTVHLARAHQGLHVPPMIWNELVEFSPDAVCLVLASAPYSEADYFRDYAEFKAAALATASTHEASHGG
jgi:dTDP-4-dehydrorhamnose 3,5-epimerase-like enzyme